MRRWDIVVTRPIKPWSSRCHGIFYQKDFFVRITPRNLLTSEESEKQAPEVEEGVDSKES